MVAAYRTPECVTSLAWFSDLRTAQRIVYLTSICLDVVMEEVVVKQTGPVMK